MKMHINEIKVLHEGDSFRTLIKIKNRFMVRTFNTRKRRTNEEKCTRNLCKDKMCEERTKLVMYPKSRCT